MSVLPETSDGWWGREGDDMFSSPERKVPSIIGRGFGRLFLGALSIFGGQSIFVRAIRGARCKVRGTAEGGRSSGPIGFHLDSPIQFTKIAGKGYH